MSPEQFKIGEVNNFFNKNDATSIFNTYLDENLDKEEKEKKRVEIIVEDLEAKLKDQKNQREQLLDQLQLEDIKM